MSLPAPPDPPRPAARPPFPIVAVIAPVVGAVVIGIVLASPFMLLFAALGPIVAVAGMVDARRSARRHQRAEAERFDRECALYERAIDEAHRVERQEADRKNPPAVHAIASPRATEAVRIGTGPARSTVLAESARPVGDAAHDQRLRGMLARARLHPQLPALIARGHVVLEGEGVVADSLARRLDGETGVTLHRAAPGSAIDALPVTATTTTVLRVMSATQLEVREPGAAVRRVRPEFVSERQLAHARASAAPSDALPRVVRWRALAEEVEVETRGRGVPIGIGEAGAVAIDLILSGPHALVGGTTGSGKSELLRSLALGWVADVAPSQAQLLFVDFKGGATFARLTDLPHVIGLVTDLDPIIAQRAMRLLRAELRQRERVLTDSGVRDLRDGPTLLPRLLVLVDEFAALAATFPELHAVFADVAARGRSLGVHLVLCTQHPASVVRDSVAANCPVRLSFRVTDAASGGIVGDRARELVAAPPGRAILVDEHGSRPVQVAVVADDDIDRVLERWRGHAPGLTTWCPPLPERLEAHDVPSADGGSESDAPHRSASAATSGPATTGDIESITFGMLDDPDEGARYPAIWRPPRDGSLAVLGASRSGRSSLLATLANGLAGSASAVVLPASVPEAWQVLERLAASAPNAAVLLCDDLDALIVAAGDGGHEVLARWDSAVRAIRLRGGAAAASIASSRAGSSLLTGRFESRVVLRCADADEHAVAGAPRALFDRRAPAGRGWWCDLQLQVIEPADALPAPERAPAPRWQPGADTDAIVIAARADALAARIAAAGLPHRLVRDIASVGAPAFVPVDGVALEPRLYLATPAQWQAAWALLSEARTRVPIAVVHGEASDVRSLLGHRDTLAPIDRDGGEIWLATPDGSITRAAWDLARDETGRSPIR